MYREPAPKVTMRWEYTILNHKGWIEELEEKLNALGLEGWELVSAEGLLFVFKRQLP